jgi:hypothetical protein
MATSGSSTDPLGSGEPSGPSFANNLTLLSYNNQQADTANKAGNTNVSNASGNLSAAANHDLGILSGDRSQVLAAEAPEISSLLSSYDSARKSTAELAPRGGGRSEQLNELPYKEAGDVNKLIETARPQAAKDLTQVAGEQTYLGTSEQGIAANDVNSSLSFLLGKADVQMNSSILQGQQGQQMGQALGQAIPQLLTMLAA